MALVDQITEFVADTDFEDIPKETISFTKHLSSKIVAAMLSGSVTLAGRKIAEYIKSKEGSAEAGVIGAGFRCVLEDAVFVNGITSHAAELEDDQFPSATSDITIFPVIFPMAEKLRLTGKEILVGSALGIEIMNRVGMFPLSSKGYTDLPFYGVIGAAVTAGKALKLSPRQLKWAIGIALGRAGGFIVNFGTDGHYIESAGACRDGLMAALLAQKDMTGNPDIEKWLEELCTGLSIDPGKIIQDLGGSTWRVHEIWVKKYPCCFLTHRHIDMMLEILAEYKIHYEHIKEIKIDVGPVDYTCDRPQPADPEDARFSFQHIMAALMLDGDIDSYHFSVEKLNDPRFRKAWAKVSVVNHSDWPPEFMSGVARIALLLNNGEKIVKDRKQALGGPELPLTADQFKRLYHKYTKNILKPEDIEDTWKTLSELEHIDDLSFFLDKIIFVKR
jgi:2-methylcitrate dehydratase PrpD